MVKNTLNVGRIAEGFVLDHIQAGRSMDIYKYLHLDQLDCCVAIIKNAKKQQDGEEGYHEDRVPHRLSSISTSSASSTTTSPSTSSRTSRSSRKRALHLPRKIRNVIRCKNPRCITSVEQELDHVFVLTDPENEVYRCMYCEEKYERRPR